MARRSERSGRRAAALLVWIRSGTGRLTLASALFAVALPFVMVATGAPGSATIAAALADPLSVLAARSPGARAPGALTQSKPLRATEVQERVLSDLRERPGVPDRTIADYVRPDAAEAPPIAGELLPGASLDEPVAIAALDATEVPARFATGGIPAGILYIPGVALPASGGTGGTGVGGGGGATGGSTGGGTTGGTGSGGNTGGGGTTPETPTPAPSPTPTPTATPTPIPETPVGAIPEPGTWLSLLIGFGVVGFALRRRLASAGTAAPLGD